MTQTDPTRPLALVTGASRGIGAELAGVLAQRGYDLLVVAEDAALGDAAERLRRHGTDVRAVTADLAEPHGVQVVDRAVADTGRPLAVAALNAGVGSGGAFVSSDLADELRLIDLNVRSTVHLAHSVLTGMLAQGEGRVLLTSSIAATMPGSHQAVYNASKSFVQSFAEAVADELRGTGVTVTSLMPGPTATDFFRRAGLPDSLMGRAPKDDPGTVARQGYDALMAGRTAVVAGSPAVQAQAALAGVVPDQVKAALHRVLARTSR
ncbi:SDR family NAD(P)-dependent oxidoreductase [Actinomycetospora sp. CA-084318]|uniref:SDR family NAD(P)-dependent oxidoreductase n=1 Tax=Actinomycetospora sp. CA-084318 TaxID=3239892 RepID=UPI003D968AC1